ncbi:MAG: efflux RND transporter permease subunit [Deltaproteobacteria bacterium]|nr:MAG: efflux RND transporter permease subunit [Deltaproteobacteria bacterium]
MWIVRLALRRPYTIAVLCALIGIFGVLSASRMKTDILPAIDIPVVIVVWNYPGLSTEDMERRVVFISERAMSTTVSGITRIDSQSMNSLGILKVYFEPGSDIGGAIAQIVSVSLTASRIMPPGITPPSIIRYNASNVPVAQMTIGSKTLSEQELFDYGLNFIRLRLFTIPGLATPAPFGGKLRQIMVDIDPARVTAKGLSPNDVVQAVLQSNVLVPAGSAQIGGTKYDVQLNSSPDTVQGFSEMPIKAVDGATVLLGDVARVRDGYAVQENVVRLNGRRATYLAILKKADASTLAVVDGARAQLPIIAAAAPQGMELKIDFDQSVFVRAAIQNVLHEGALASVLVSLMILFFLGSWRGALMVMTSIPLAILVGLVGLFLFGHTLNLMTMGGLALAIGMLVDDATVEVENIHRNRHLGKPITVAILDGAQQIAVPALAATLTICVVFFPVVLLEGPAQFLFTALALGVVISMLASYLLSRTLVPTLARILMEKEELHAGGEGIVARFNRWRDRGFARFQEAYGRTLGAVLHHRALVLICAGLVLACTAFLPFVVGLDFFPAVDAGQMRLHYRAPIGTRLEETDRQVARLEQRIQDIVPAAELETINSNIGMPISYNLAFVQTDNTGSQDADILVALKPKHAPTERYMERIRRELPDEFPGATLYFQPADIVSQVLNFGLSAPIDVQIDGPDVEASYAVARELVKKIRAIPGATDVRIPQVLAYPALRVDVDRSRAAQIGITERDVANNLLVSLSSSSLVAPSFWINPKNNVNYPVVVQTPIRQIDSVPSLLGMPLGRAALVSSSTPAPGDTPAGGGSYLGAVASLRPATGLSMINHVSVQRVVDVQASATGRDLGGVTLDIQKAIGSIKNLPKATRISLRGQSESMFAAFNRLGVGLILAIALVYLLLVVLFQSFLDPFIILVAVPGALVGILWMLAFTGTTLNVESFMGAIMAVGIATSNSILLVSAANDARVAQGVSVVEGAIVAGKTRLRPVLMTALAMLLGMVPMALAIGEGGEQNAPLGRAVIGGLIVATFVTLFIVPAVYTLVRKAPPSAHKLDAKFAAESRGASEAAHA